MRFSTSNAEPRTVEVWCTDDELVAGLTDGRRLLVPLAWFPRLAKASAQDRESFEFLGDGEGVHWPGVDEDISIAGLLQGFPSVETLDAAGARSV